MKKRKFLLVMIIFIALSFAYSCSWNQKDNKQDCLVVMDSVINLGNINWGDTSLFSSTYKNISQQNVTIEYINASCGCLNSEFQTTPVLPQDTSIIFFTFNPSNQGYVEKNIFVYFKNYNVPSHILLKARVK